MACSSSRKISSISVFGSTKLGKESVFIESAHRLGRVLAEKKINLVYGGGTFGLMGCVSLMASLAGANVLAVVPTPLKKISPGSFGNILEVPSMHERLPKMLEHSDAFIALPGGIGTLEGILQIVSWATLNIHSKPIGLLNIDGFFDGLLTFLDHAVAKGFMTDSVRQIFLCASNPEQLIEQLQAFEFKIDPIVPQLDETGGRGKKRKDELDLTLSL